MNIKDKITKQLEDYKKIQEYLKDNFESFLSANSNFAAELEPFNAAFALL